MYINVLCIYIDIYIQYMYINVIYIYIYIYILYTLARDLTKFHTFGSYLLDQGLALRKREETLFVLMKTD